MQINAKTVRGLQPSAQGNRIVYDDQIPGFGVRITPAGAISFVLNYRIHGRERRYTIGRHGEMSALMAREEALRLRDAIRQGHDPLAERDLLRTSPTMVDLAEEYLQRHAETYKRPASIREDKRLLSAIILPRWGRLRVAAIARRDVEKLHQDLRTTPVQGNRVVALVRKIFNLAIQWGWVQDNPARGMNRYPEQPRDRWLQREELERLREALDKHPDQNQADALRLILFTGSRKSEVLAATWNEFDLERGVWTRPSHHTKQKRVEHVPLGRVTLELLTGMKERAEGQYLFLGKAGGHLRDLKGAWMKITKTARLDGVHIHDLRHTFASHLVSRGAPLALVGGLLGHTQAQTTMRYAHLADGALRAATNEFAMIYEKGKKGRSRQPKP